ncbi:hypothetical protein [Streptomyces sp. NPDC097619]|uniref:hypothetical protein n=1 Tax=Streptomyces sp. NPDC097619 TaxID=3157228 RepID=UPI0033177D27
MAPPSPAREPRSEQPDPAGAAPDLPTWSALARRVHEELYLALDPADRPTRAELVEAAGYDPGVWSGERRPGRTAFLRTVELLGGTPAAWEPRWWAVVEAGEPGPEVPELLPGVAVPDPPPVPAAPDLGGALPRHPVRRLLRTLLDRLLMIVTWPGRGRRDRHERQLRRGLAKRVVGSTERILAVAEEHHYLTPVFHFLTEQPPIPGQRRRGRTARRAAPLEEPTGTSDVHELYRRYDELVVLGKPGLGKTVQLARLAHRMAVDFLEAPEDDGSHDIPVLLSLDTYRGQPIEEWLVAAMREYASGALVRTWLEQHRLVPVLDGLDEVPEGDRARCVAELRRLRETCPGLVVGCRTDVADLRRLAFDLRAPRYVEVQPPGRPQVQEFLAADRHALAHVETALEEEPELWELLRSPMMLHFIAVTYRGRDAAELLLPGTPAERRSRLFDAYVRECLLRDRPDPDRRPEHTVTWLTALARTLARRKEGTLYLDRLDLDWLDRSEGILPRVLPNLVMAACSLGLPVLWIAVAVRAGVLDTSVRDAALLAGTMTLTSAFQGVNSEQHFLRADRERPGDERLTEEQLERRQNRGALTVPLLANVPVIVFGSAVMAVVGVDYSAPGCIVVGLAFLWVWATQMEASFTEVFQPVERLRWTWRRKERMIYPPVKFHLVRGSLNLVMWVCLALLLGYVAHLLCPDPPWLGPVAASLLGLVYVFGNQFEPSLQERRPRPNEGIRRTVRFALVHGSAGLVAATLVVLVPAALALWGREPERAAYAAALFGLLFAVVRGFRYGGLAILRHWSIRLVLAYRGHTPYRYRRFLAAAEHRALLFRGDSGYSFPHRLLQEHLDTTAEELLPRVVPRTGAGSGRGSDGPVPTGPALPEPV